MERVTKLNPQDGSDLRAALPVAEHETAFCSRVPDAWKIANVSFFRRRRPAALHGDREDLQAVGFQKSAPKLVERSVAAHHEIEGKPYRASLKLTAFVDESVVVFDLGIER